MKRIHNITVSVFAKPEEDVEKIKENFISLFPFPLDEKKVPLVEKNASGFGERIIKIYEVELSKDRYIDHFMENLLTSISSEQKEMLVKQKESRLDEELCFFIRLDKEKLMNGSYWVTDSGKCYHVKIKIAAFPAKRENALGIVEEIFIK